MYSCLVKSPRVHFFLVEGWLIVNIVELFYLRQLHKKMPKKTPEHVKMLFNLLEENKHFYIAEISGANGNPQATEKIVHDLEKCCLLEKKGNLLTIKKIEKLI